MAAIAVDDVSVAIGRPISDIDEVAQVQQWIDDVELILTARIGDLSLVNQPLLRYVEREAVVGRMRDRQDKDADDRNYFLGILDPWWALLELGDTQGQSFYSIRPGFTPDAIQWARFSPADRLDGWCWR